MAFVFIHETERANDFWNTPPKIVHGLGRPFDLDPCSADFPICKIANKTYNRAQNGLGKIWKGEVFLNPPYSKIEIWMERMSCHANGVALVFARTDTRWFQSSMQNATGINLIFGRICFLTDANETVNRPEAPSCLIAWGEKSFQRIKNIEGIICRVEN